MRAILAKLMSLWVVVLTLSGWCCHPPFCTGREPTVMVQDDAPRLCQCCHRPSHRTTTSLLPADCCAECQGTCTYVAPPKVEFDDGHVLPAMECVATVLPAVVTSQSVPTVEAQQLASLRPPIRLHLVNQILLI